MSNKIKCPNCGSENVQPYKEASEYARDGFLPFWVLFSIQPQHMLMRINP